jgi:DNA-binding GntR family transcriptional regulator
MARRVLSDEIFEAMRSSILHGEYRPNQRLVELEIAENLRASRTPVREAMQRLAAEGLIARDRRGWVVHEFSPHELREILETRAALEGFATRLAALRASDDQLREIATLYPPYDELLAHHASERHIRIVELNDAYHALIAGCCGNARLEETIRRNGSYYFNYPVAGHYTNEEHRSAFAEHDRITAALVARDEVEAEQAMRAHILSQLQGILTKVWNDGIDRLSVPNADGVDSSDGHRRMWPPSTMNV